MTENTTAARIPRAFTKADIEQFFNEHFRKNDYPQRKLNSIVLLPQIDPPTWLIDYESVWNGGITNYYKVIVTQVSSPLEDQPFWLTIAHEVKIPDGMSVAEEDAEMKRREDAAHAKWQAKLEAKQEGAA